jgi:hypothetical protein
MDPSHAHTWYVATDTGVYRTQNSGTNWLPFDNGIPNVPVTGLVVDRAAKILYAGTMGRGAFKLDITPGVTKPFVDIYVRDNNLDTGERLPSPSGIPDPLIPAPGTANFWMSPDIKVNHAPVFTPTGVFDGVVFDVTLQHQDPVRGQSNRFYVQVHNRGWQTAHNVSVRAFIADACAGLPNLPNVLIPPNFHLISTATWHPVGPAQTIAELKPNRPAVVFWDFAVPFSAGTHTCCLAVMSSPDDPFYNPTTHVGHLVTTDKRVCLKNLHVVDPGPGPMELTMFAIDFHQALYAEGLTDIVIRPSGFARGSVALLLPKLDLADPKTAFVGVQPTPIRKDDPIGRWYSHSNPKLEALLSKRLDGCDRTVLFEFDQTKPSEIRGIRLRPEEVLRGILVASLKRDISTFQAPRIEILQRLDQKVIGGSTFLFGQDLSNLPLIPPAD